MNPLKFSPQSYVLCTSFKLFWCFLSDFLNWDISITEERLHFYIWVCFNLMDYLMGSDFYVSDELKWGFIR